MRVSCVVLMEGEYVEGVSGCVSADRTHVQAVVDGSRSQEPQYAVEAAATGHTAPCIHWCWTEEGERQAEIWTKLRGREGMEERREDGGVKQCEVNKEQSQGRRQKGRKGNYEVENLYFQ